MLSHLSSPEVTFDLSQIVGTQLILLLPRAMCLTVSSPIDTLCVVLDLAASCFSFTVRLPDLLQQDWIVLEQRYKKLSAIYSY